tara:strand:+ start:872 stop:1285 length:414 start_codon:yes stop_codon:yes gene_type:complete
MRLGDFYYYGFGGVNVNYDRSIALYRYASDRDIAQASFNLGYMHENGLGVPRDFHLAKRFYDQAVAKNPDAYLPVLLVLAAWGVKYVYYEGYTALTSFLVFMEGTTPLPDVSWDTIALCLLSVLLFATLVIRLQILA